MMQDQGLGKEKVLLEPGSFPLLSITSSHGRVLSLKLSVCGTSRQVFRCRDIPLYGISHDSDKY